MYDRFYKQTAEGENEKLWKIMKNYEELLQNVNEWQTRIEKMLLVG